MCYVACVTDEDVARRYELVRPHLDEKARRLVVSLGPRLAPRCLQREIVNGCDEKVRQRASGSLKGRRC